MTFEVRHDLMIDTTPERVWAVLTDFASYPEWNPLVRSFEGELHEGARVLAVFEPMPGRRVRARPTLTAVDKPRRLAWAGKVGLEALMRGEHSYELVPRGGGVELVNREVFEGLLVPLARPLLRRTQAGYVRNSEAIKARAEAG
jgi:hypothetical protein